MLTVRIHQMLLQDKYLCHVRLQHFKHLLHNLCFFDDPLLELLRIEAVSFDQLFKYFVPLALVQFYESLKNVWNGLVFFLFKLCRVLRVDEVALVAPDYKILAEGAIVLWVKDNHLMVARLQISRKSIPLMLVNIVGMQIRTVDHSHISKLIVVRHIVEQVCPALKSAVELKLFPQLVRVILEHFLDIAEQ